MHVDAGGVAVDLGGADLHQFDETWLEAGLDGVRHAHPVLHQRRGSGEEIKFSGHGSVSFCRGLVSACDMMVPVLRDRDVSVSSVSSHVAGRYFEACRLGG